MGNLGGHLPMEAGLQEQCQDALKHFETLGCQVIAPCMHFDLEALWRAWMDLRSFMIAGAYGQLYAEHGSRTLLKPEAIWEIERGLKLSGVEVYAAARIRSRWYLHLCELFTQFDYLVLPATQVFPFPADQHWPAQVAGHAMDTYHRWLQAAVPATMAGLPALAAPAGLNPRGLPAGIQILGPTQADVEVLQLGLAYDQASGYSRMQRPMLPPDQS